MKSLKAKVNAAPLNNKDDKIVIKMEDFNDDDEDDDEQRTQQTQHRRKSSSDDCGSNESGFGTVDEVNSIESDQSLKEPAVINLNNNPVQLFQQQSINTSDQYQLDQPDVAASATMQQPKPRQAANTLYDCGEHMVILNTSSTHSSVSNLSSTTFSRRLEDSRFLRYLCCCCTCCSTTNQIFWSWLSIFCCCCPLLGLCSLYFTYKSKKFKLKQKYELSDRYSNYAEKLNIASLIFGILFYAVAFFIITLVLFMYWRHSYA